LKSYTVDICYRLLLSWRPYIQARYPVGMQLFVFDIPQVFTYPTWQLDWHWISDQ